ncbi:hypothetical protein QBC33DRAFT_486401 [Phialemonium atrogriseum]|uniref:Pentatricopeptide repeat domain-containing protein n=1 Tax=Phialemonium atrogriseum TaxID=1093897 RepID=A0AAJ0CAB6_9PEZI|nr:uncharacterized protein QBC33DRAFT_486401 [Phialemonium atrogriseum]KAK1770631.1 hypothetical protein QBC33DRAFT_486401 [Phialemonium atrogriseum]
MRLVYRNLRQVNRYAHQGFRTCSRLQLVNYSLQSPKSTNIPARNLVHFRSIVSSAAVVVDRNETRELDHLDHLLEEFLERSPEIEPLDDEDTRVSPSLYLEDGTKRSMSLPGEPSARLGGLGKWHSLARDHQRLLFESDVASDNTKSFRLIDDPENENDVELWNCILAFRYRRDGPGGVAMVFRGLQMRRTLRDVEGDGSTDFWQTILNVALHDEVLLEGVWEYAEWLHQAHGVRWPRLYQTVIASFVSRRQEKEALRWHLRLSPNFGLEAPSFARMLQRFIRDPDPVIQDTLKGLYRLSIHRRLYDSLVPYLYAQGTQSIARTWRKFLLYHNDVPSSLAARPFLRFLAGYFPRDPMVRTEFLAAGIKEPAEYNSDIPGNDVVADKSFSHLVNKVRGRRFGIQEKTYNDALGARWFASSWISLDMAVEVVRILGVDRIGPLSLQSIALRERSSDRILHRLDQLETFNISIGTSSYAKAIRHFAAVDDYEALTDLLRSDVHPDVFDDLNIQQLILGSAVMLGDWKKYRLILAVRLAVSLDSVALASNAVLSACLGSGNKQMTLRVLEDMNSRGVQVFPSTSNAISMHIIRDVSPHAQMGDRPPLDLPFYVAICRRIMAMRFPLATRALQTILFRLAREGHTDDLERLSLEILQRYHSFQTSERATLNVHKFDVPDILKKESHYRSFQMIPRDLSLFHELHPIQLIFNKKLQHCIIRCGFARSTLYRHRYATASLTDPTQPVDFAFARGIRLVALWKERGVSVDIRALRKVVQLRLADLYGADWSANQRLRSAVRGNRLTLEEAKSLCDEAWGSEILPPIPELREAVRKLGRARTEQWSAFINKKAQQSRDENNECR